MIHIRALCKFLRNETHRNQIILKLKSIYPCVVKLLVSFNVSLAKWRYEILHDSERDLLKVCDLLTKHVIKLPNMFASSQEHEVVVVFFKACNCTELWSFMHASFWFAIFRMEKARRCGLVCECLKDVYDRGLKPHCPYSSRRMHQARAYIESFVDKLRSFSPRLNLSNFDDRLDLQGWLAYSIRRLIRDVQGEVAFF